VALSLSTVEEQRLRDLRRMKTFATGLLVLAAIVLLIARANEDGPAWVGYVRATVEAAMVGALADWFAVTALFKHPLGIPIPHTAIIPRRKAEIGRNLGQFVQENFLTREVLGERLAAAGVGRRVGVWLSQPVHAERASEAISDGVRGAVEVLDDQDVQEALETAVVRRLRATEVTPLLGKALDVAIHEDHHQRLLEGALKSVGAFLDDNRATLRAQLDKESPWWVPESIDDRVFNKIFTGVQNFVADVIEHPEHEVRASIDGRVRQFAERLRTDPVLIAKGEELKAEILAHADVQAWLGSLWGELKKSMLDAVGDPQSELRRRLTAGLVRVGERLAVDAELQRKLDDWVERLVGYVVDHYRDEVADLIAGTVALWDAAETSRRIELQVGRDLQFIRINGTVVGGLAGLTIYTLGNWLF
jgi:uncharacterized membrane-anchored protein YjiN (DUF445 family)